MQRPRASLLLVLGTLACLLSPSLLLGGPQLEDADCSTPYRATYTWLEWLQPERFDAPIAATCFAKGTSGLTRTEIARRAEMLKEVADSRGLWIPLDDIPDEADYVDPVSGLPRYPILPKALNVALERRGDQWVFTPETLDIALELHEETFNVGLQALLDRAPSWAHRSLFGLQIWQYIGLLLLLGLAFPLGRLLGHVLGGLGGGLLRRAKLKWGPELLERMVEPLRLLGSATIVWLFLPQLRLPIQVSVVFGIAISLFMTVSVVWASYRAVDVLADDLATRAEDTVSRMDDQLIPLVRKSLKIIVALIGGVFILQNLNVDVGSLIAGLGIGGLAFALAAKDTLANLFGSLMIFLDRPFQVGDWVTTSGVEGVVETVGFRSTRIRTFANSLITVPNAKVADSVIDNMGERTYRRLKTVLNLTYDTSPEQMQAFVEGVRAILKANPHVRQDYYEVHFYSFGAHSLDVLLYAFLKVPSWSEELRQRQNIFLEIMGLAREVGVSFAFPTQTLHIDSMAKPGDYEPPAPPDEDALIGAVHAFAPKGRLSRPDGPKLTEGYFAGIDSAKGSAGE